MSDNDELHVALFSGGQDSAVATHAAMRWGPAELVMYLDTGTGLQQNREYVRRFADRYNWHLIEWRTPENYKDLIKKYGFPGPSKHNWFYRYLKERQLQKLAGITAKDVHFWTGVHKAESDNRMDRVVEKQDGGDGRWIFRAPMTHWQPKDFRRYLGRFNLPRNPLWRTLGRSGDCYCGAFANRMELIDMDALGADRADWLREIERELEQTPQWQLGFDDERRGEWAWHDGKKHVANAIDDDKQFSLCSYCGELPEKDKNYTAREAPEPYPGMRGTE